MNIQCIYMQIVFYFSYTSKYLDYENIATATVAI